MSDIFKAYKVDEAKSKEGVWYKLNHFDAALKLRPVNKYNPEFAAQIVELQAQAAQAKSADDKVNALVDIYAKAVVVDWKNIARDGVALPCTEENVKVLLNELPVVLDEVIAFLSDFRNFSESSPYNGDYDGKK